MVERHLRRVHGPRLRRRRAAPSGPSTRRSTPTPATGSRRSGCPARQRRRARRRHSRTRASSTSTSRSTDGTGAILALPHLGGWEWAAFWLARVPRHAGHRRSSSRSSRPSCSSGSSTSAESLGMNVVPLGPGGRPRRRPGAEGSNHVVCLLCDRDIGRRRGRGRVLRRAHDAARRARPRSRCAPARRCSRPRSTSGAATHHGVVPPAHRRRARRARCATTSPASPRPSPTSSRTSSAGARAVAPASSPTGRATGRPRQRRPLRARRSVGARHYAAPCASGWSARTASRSPAACRAQVLGLARALRALGHEARVLAPCDGPPPDAVRHAARPQRADRGQRLGRAARARPVGPAAHDPGAARRGASTSLHLHEPLAPGPDA